MPVPTPAGAASASATEPGLPPLLRRVAIPLLGSCLAGGLYLLWPQHPEFAVIPLFLTLLASALSQR